MMGAFSEYCWDKTYEKAEKYFTEKVRAEEHAKQISQLADVARSVM